MKEVTPDELLNLGFHVMLILHVRLAYDDQVRFPVPVLSPHEFEILVRTRHGRIYIDEIV